VIDGALWRDIRHAARVARMNAGFSSMVALTIAVGIGSTLTTFSAVDRLLLRGPELVTQSDRVARLYVTTRAPGRPERTSSTVGYAAYRPFATMCAPSPRSAHTATRESSSDAGSVRYQRLAEPPANFFGLLGVRPRFGRVFSADEDRPESAAQVVVLDYDSGSDSMAESRPRSAERSS
jgi:hypothetical protein